MINPDSMHFKSCIEMIETSIQHGLLRGRFKVHAEFVEDISRHNGEYIMVGEARNILCGANSHWSKYFMERAINRSFIKIIKKKKFGYRWALLEDVNKLRDKIYNIVNPVMTEDGRCKFVEIFGYNRLSYPTGIKR